MTFTKTDYGETTILEVEYTHNERRKFAYIGYSHNDHEKMKKKLISYVERITQ